MGLEKVVVGDNFRLRDLGLREMGLLSWEYRSIRQGKGAGGQGLKGI